MCICGKVRNRTGWWQFEGAKGQVPLAVRHSKVLSSFSWSNIPRLFRLTQTKQLGVGPRRLTGSQEASRGVSKSTVSSSCISPPTIRCSMEALLHTRFSLHASGFCSQGWLDHQAMRNHHIRWQRWKGDKLTSPQHICLLLFAVCYTNQHSSLFQVTQSNLEENLASCSPPYSSSSARERAGGMLLLLQVASPHSPGGLQSSKQADTHHHEPSSLPFTYLELTAHPPTPVHSKQEWHEGGRMNTKLQVSEGKEARCLSPLILHGAVSTGHVHYLACPLSLCRGEWAHQQGWQGGI